VVFAKSNTKLYSFSIEKGIIDSYSLGKEYRGNKETIKLTLIDGREIICTPEHKFKVKVDDGILVESLKTHDQKISFDSTEVYLRQIFDDYFTGITELIILSNTGLVDKRNLKKFLKYWVDILNGNKRNKPEIFVQTISNYINFYGYEEVSKFLK
jgi:intein/homing endonuclease